MVVDTSALVAILRNEPERRKFNEAIEAAHTRSMSVACFLESSIILESRFGADGVHDLDLFITRAQIALAAVDEEQALLARDGFRHFGKGRHPAGLTYGDCFSYALARSLDEELLFKGQDFRQTDVECHPASG